VLSVLAPVLYSLMGSRVFIMWMSLGNLLRRPGVMHEVRVTKQRSKDLELDVI
jgi:hypothetical protein